MYKFNGKKKKSPLPLLSFAHSVSHEDKTIVGHVLEYLGYWCLHMPHSLALSSTKLNGRQDPLVLLAASKQQQVLFPAPFCSPCQVTGELSSKRLPPKIRMTCEISLVSLWPSPIRERREIFAIFRLGQSLVIQDWTIMKKEGTHKRGSWSQSLWQPLQLFTSCFMPEIKKMSQRAGYYHTVQTFKNICTSQQKFSESGCDRQKNFKTTAWVLRQLRKS